MGTEIQQWLLSWQASIIALLEKHDASISCIDDSWNHREGGGGTSCIFKGTLIESSAVNFSCVLGTSLPPSALKEQPELSGLPFQAMGVSCIIHPMSPFAPTTHTNLRLFETEKDWWFGGGFDLTPFYFFKEDAIVWHQKSLEACLPFGEDIYPEFKAWCDRYFYLPHREETRGIGGLFFDHLNRWPKEKCFSFIQSVGNAFVEAYDIILERRIHLPYTPEQRAFQAYRRGRYVEFNLLYDRGTLFGLQSKGRTESILASLPANVSWQYNWQPDNDTPEATLYDYLVPIDWLAIPHD